MDELSNFNGPIGSRIITLKIYTTIFQALSQKKEMQKLLDDARHESVRKNLQELMDLQTIRTNAVLEPLIKELEEKEDDLPLNIVEFTISEGIQKDINKVLFDIFNLDPIFFFDAWTNMILKQKL